jgi:hypothetical protein
VTGKWVYCFLVAVLSHSVLVYPQTSQSESAASTLSTSKSDTKPPSAGSVEVNFPNFTSCTIAELQQIVPELKGLQAAPDQQKLADLLDEVGAKTLDIARNTPNLISQETVIEKRQYAGETRRDYDYLILAHTRGKIVDLDEYRVDLKSGEKFQTDEVMERASRGLAALQAGRLPAIQGFATSWIDFAPGSRGQTAYRYLGEQKMGGQRTLVLAYAQRRASVISPATFSYQGETVPMYLQGVAWVDPSDFRIVRLRTDLLSTLDAVPLHRMTAVIQFGFMQIQQLPPSLFLPREVTVTFTVGGSTWREVHKYSKYRLFHVQSRIVPTPSSQETTSVTQYLESFPGPQTYKDPHSGTTLYVETDGRHLAAISGDGKLLWVKDPFEEGHLDSYRTNKPQIVYIGPLSKFQSERPGVESDKFVAIRFNFSQSGLINVSSGDFQFLGQD